MCIARCFVDNTVNSVESSTILHHPLPPTIQFPIRLAWNIYIFWITPPPRSVSLEAAQ